MNFQIVVLY